MYPFSIPIVEHVPRPRFTMGLAGLKPGAPGKRGPVFLPKNFKFLLKELPSLSHKL